MRFWLALSEMEGSGSFEQTKIAIFCTFENYLFVPNFVATLIDGPPQFWILSQTFLNQKHNKGTTKRGGSIFSHRVLTFRESVPLMVTTTALRSKSTATMKGVSPTSTW